MVKYITKQNLITRYKIYFLKIHNQKGDILHTLYDSK